MKYFNSLISSRKLSALGVAVLAGVGVAQAQHTGIGTTTPTASLHVFKNAGATDAFRVEGLEEITDVGTYTQFMLTDPSTGIVRRMAIDELLDETGEWVYDATAETLTPRRTNADLAGGVSFGETGATVPFTVVGATSITGATTIAGATSITGATNVIGTFTVDASASTLGGTLSVAGTSLLSGEVTMGTVNQAATPAPDNATQILISGPGGVVQYVTVADLLEENGIWEYDDPTTPTLIRPRIYNNAMNINDALVKIGSTGTPVPFNVDGATTITGATSITGATTIAGATSVTGNTDITGTFDVTGASVLTGPVRYNGVADALDIDNLTTNTAIGTHNLVMIQDANGIVRNITVENLLDENGEWVYNSTDNVIEPRRFATSMDVGTTVDINVATTLDGQFDVTGATTIVGATSITGATNVIGTFTVDASASTLGGSLTVAGASVFNNTVQYAGAADGLDIDNLTTNTAIGTHNLVLTQDANGIVRNITVDNLLQENGEWVYDDNGTAGTYDAGDVVYLRRAGQDGTNDVFATFEGDFVIDAARAYQFGGATNQVTANSITSATAYTMGFGGALTANIAGGATFNTAADGDVAFNENAQPWLFYDADAGGATERGRVGINTNAPLATLHVAGNMVASNVTVTSDRRFKRNIEEFKGALDAVSSLRGVSYHFRKDEFPSENFDEASHLGFIAQEIQAILPQAVTKRDDGYLTVDYGAVTPVLVEAIQELNAKVVALETENAALRSTSKNSVGAVSTKQMTELQAQLASMSARLDEVAGRK